MMKTLFRYFTDSFSLSENPINNYVLMAIVGFMSCIAAYLSVGKLYQIDFIDGSAAGRFLHWTIRAIVFAVICELAATLMRVYDWFRGLQLMDSWLFKL